MVIPMQFAVQNSEFSWLTHLATKILLASDWIPAKADLFLLSDTLPLMHNLL